MSIHSDWGAWVPDAVVAAEPDGVAIWYLGCNGFVLKATEGTTMFIDPYLGTGDPPRTVRMIPVPFEPSDVHEADAILGTHEHTDHVHGPSQAPILERTGGTFIGPDASIDVTAEEGWTEHWDVDPDQFTTVAEGDTVSVGAFTIHVVETHDPDADHPVGYVIEHDAGTFFHGGDTKPARVLEATGERFDIDLGAVAFGSVGMVPEKETGEPVETIWYGNEADVVRSARYLQLDRVLPTHWDMWRGLTADPTAIIPHARTFEYPKRVELMEIGDRIVL